MSTSEDYTDSPVNEDGSMQDNPQEYTTGTDQPGGAETGYRIISLDGMYENWFLDYASYVILERAVPDVIDGLKPVQRRILHAMYEMEDGRYNKVANIIGRTMQYHPHGDASIGEALIQLGQKDLLIDTQGNWGNILTGDSAAAPRYIEARLSKFALEVVFNPKTTRWKNSYDGRNREPILLPVKFPLLLAQGVEGIAVGLASKILPHNFNELIDAAVAYLQGKEFELYPDFPQGGMIDVSRYNRGLRGGKVRVRARIRIDDKKNLTITEIPYGTTTTALIESIIAANDKGKIKIRKIDDNTADKVEIKIQLQPGVSPDQTIDALYAFTDCEISISPNACVIYQGKPRFLGVDDILRISVDNTVELIRQELNIRRDELLEQWHFATLEKIFIRERIYRKIEQCETWESVIHTIEKALKPFKHLFRRDITQEDITRLTEIKIKRITKFNSDKADETIRSIENELAEVENHLQHLIDFVIRYFRAIKKKYGTGRERRTEIRSFDTIEATLVAAANQKLYLNREEGFAGTALKKAEYICDCSDLDDVIVFRDDGTYVVTKIAPKFYVGKNVIHIDVFKRNDERTIYNVVYRDGKLGASYVKRFAVKGITRDKEYQLTQGKEGSRVLYFSANPDGEAEIITVQLKPRPRLKKTTFDFDFSTLAIKNRNSIGNILTKHQVKKIFLKEEGVSTLGGMDIWFDDTIQRLNTEERGIYLGSFKSGDKIVAFMQSGEYRITGFDLMTRFDSDVVLIEQFDPERIFTAVYLENQSGLHFIKRFTIEETDKKISFLPDDLPCTLVTVSSDERPVLKLSFDHRKNQKTIDDETLVVEEFIAVKSLKARGKRLSKYYISAVEWLEPLEPEITPETDGTGENGQEEPADDTQNGQSPDDTASLPTGISLHDGTEKGPVQPFPDFNLSPDQSDEKTEQQKVADLPEDNPSQPTGEKPIQMTLF